MDDVRVLAGLPQKLHGRAREEGEAQDVVLVSVDRPAVEEVVLGVGLDEEALAVVDEAEIDGAVDGPLVPGDPEVAIDLVQLEDVVVAQVVVLGQDDLDVIAADRQLAAQPEDHVRQSADLGHWGHLRGDVDDDRGSAGAVRAAEPDGEPARAQGRAHSGTTSGTDSGTGSGSAGKRTLSSDSWGGQVGAPGLARAREAAASFGTSMGPGVGPRRPAGMPPRGVVVLAYPGCGFLPWQAPGSSPASRVWRRRLAVAGYLGGASIGTSTGVSNGISVGASAGISVGGSRLESRPAPPPEPRWALGPRRLSGSGRHSVIGGTGTSLVGGICSATGSTAGWTGRAPVGLAGPLVMGRPGVRLLPEGFFAIAIALTLAVAAPRALHLGPGRWRGW